MKKFFKWFTYKENILMLLGALIALTAVAVPFSIIYFTKTSYSMQSFEKLGTVGDFFGGTTVGLLSLASIIFVTAAIIMQKEELKLQREEVKKTREEYEVTNATMKRQQFDSTFFNMINLHHKIVSEIEYDSTKGRAVHKMFHDKMNKKYSGEVRNEYTQKMLSRILQDDEEKQVSFALETYLFSEKHRLIEQVISDPSYTSNDRGEWDSEVFDEVSRNILSGEHELWLNRRDVIISAFHNQLSNDHNFLYDILSEINFIGLIETDVEYEYVDIFKRNFIITPLKELRDRAFELTYNELEQSMGHYFRNFYRIITLIQDEIFHNDPVINEKERQKYRGILRDQLSSIELIAIFYNITYSKKGESFKKYFAHINFFDDHIVESDFIWSNDSLELSRLNIPDN
ncbi:putative phage abortive infection protein [Paenibacillus illinoisensis]|uniref:putative phage abortive infection protein n=1 Tax=Paenibacillus illinoisensis TaxID=59845 RepID=UPI00301C8FCC